MTWNLRKNSKFRVSCQSETKDIGSNRCTLLPFMTAWTMSRSLLLMLTNPKEEKDGGRGRRSWVPTEQHMESLVNECQWARSKRRQNWCWRSHKRQKFEKKLRKKGREVLLTGPKMFRRFFLFRLEGFIRYVKIAKWTTWRVLVKNQLQLNIARWPKKWNSIASTWNTWVPRIWSGWRWSGRTWTRVLLSMIFYMWFYILGSRNEAKRFSYVLKLFGAKATNIFEGQVAAIAESFDTLWKSGKCFAILHDALVAQFLDVYLRSGTYENWEEIKDDIFETEMHKNDENAKE